MLCFSSFSTLLSYFPVFQNFFIAELFSFYISPLFTHSYFSFLLIFFYAFQLPSANEGGCVMGVNIAEICQFREQGMLNHSTPLLCIRKQKCEKKYRKISVKIRMVYSFIELFSLAFRLALYSLLPWLEQFALHMLIQQLILEPFIFCQCKDFRTWD